MLFEQGCVFNLEDTFFSLILNINNLPFKILE